MTINSLWSLHCHPVHQILTFQRAAIGSFDTITIIDICKYVYHSVKKEKRILWYYCTDYKYYIILLKLRFNRKYWKTSLDMR